MTTVWEYRHYHNFPNLYHFTKLSEKCEKQHISQISLLTASIIETQIFMFCFVWILLLFICVLYDVSLTYRQLFLNILDVVMMSSVVGLQFQSHISISIVYIQLPATRHLLQLICWLGTQATIILIQYFTTITILTFIKLRESGLSNVKTGSQYHIAAVLFSLCGAWLLLPAGDDLLQRYRIVSNCYTLSTHFRNHTPS